MKIKLTFLDTEKKELAAVMAALLRLFPDARPKLSDKRPPYKHMYFRIRTPEKKNGPEV